jgi:hypothetical protein
LRRHNRSPKKYQEGHALNECVRPVSLHGCSSFYNRSTFSHLSGED